MVGRSSHFRAAWEDQDDSSPLPDDRDVHTAHALGTNQGGTASLPSPLNARGEGFLSVQPLRIGRERSDKTVWDTIFCLEEERNETVWRK